MPRLKVLTVVGTRPELIRLSRLIPALDELTNHVVIHTGQNYASTLKEDIINDLELRTPDVFLASDSSSLGSAIGSTFSLIERHFVEQSPDCVIVLGDTNSGLTAILAERLGIPVYHLEAGNRSFDANVPEELNRKIIDHASSFNLPYTERARENLISEGIPRRRILVTGSPMAEVLDHYKSKIDRSTILGDLGLSRGGYIVASVHRQENLNPDGRLLQVLETLSSVSERFDRPIVLSCHPRLMSRISALKLRFSNQVRVFEPFKFTDYMALQVGALCVMSDSGTVSEESSILGFPAVTIRDSMERPEALDSGSIVLAGIELEDVTRAIEFKLRYLDVPPVEEYLPRDFSLRVINFVLSTVSKHKGWAGLHA